MLEKKNESKKRNEKRREKKSIKKKKKRRKSEQSSGHIRTYTQILNECSFLLKIAETGRKLPLQSNQRRCRRRWPDAY